MTHRQRLVLAFALHEVDRFCKQLRLLVQQGVHIPQEARDAFDTERERLLRKWAEVEGHEYSSYLAGNYVQEATEAVQRNIAEVDRILAEHEKGTP